MSKELKRIIICVLSVCLTICMFLPAFADEFGNTNVNDFTTETIETSLDNYPSFRHGDLNGDNRITAQDARIALRADAHLEELTDEQKYAVDVFGNGELTSKNARKILRISANLDKMDCFTATINLGESFKIKGLADISAKTDWKCFVDLPDDMSICETIYSVNREIAGASYGFEFTLTPIKTGTYIITVDNLDMNNEAISPGMKTTDTITLEVI